MQTRNKIYCLGLIVFQLFGACQEEAEKPFVKKDKMPVSLIRNQLLFSDRESEYSFPIWFNDSLIKAYKIESITRNRYDNKIRVSTKNDTLPETPIEKICYYFNKQGFVSKITLTSYFDDRQISHLTFYYNQIPNQNGYANWLLDSISETSKKGIYPLITTTDVFANYSQKQTKKGYAIFQNRITNDYLNLISEKENWGALAIDKLFRPNPLDILLLGTAEKPEKIYRVENKVNEIDVVQFEYDQDKILKITKHAYPFLEKRNFSYNQQGHCIGYVDSTFSDKEFLTRNITIFQNNALQVPEKIIRRQETSEGLRKLIETEEINYTFRK